MHVSDSDKFQTKLSATPCPPQCYLCTECVANRCTLTSLPEGIEARDKNIAHCNGGTMKLTAESNECRVWCKAGFRPSNQLSEGKYSCGIYGGTPDGATPDGGTPEGGTPEGPGIDCQRTYQQQHHIPRDYLASSHANRTKLFVHIARVKRVPNTHFEVLKIQFPSRKYTIYDNKQSI